MAKNEYSAGMVKMPFWFLEFKKMINLINSGKTMSEIKEQNLTDNIFSASTKTRAIQVFSTVSSRMSILDPKFYSLFEKLDISNQKLIVLIAIMESDSLFFEFMYDVFREKLIIGTNEISESDIRIFFKNKQVQSERVAKWTDETLQRLGASYKNVLMETGILSRSQGSKAIIKPILDRTLEQHLKDCGMEPILNALTGVR